MEVLRQLYLAVFSPSSIWSVLARGLLWFVVALVVIVSSDKADPEKSLKDLKSNLGFLIIFLAVSAGLLYLLFGYHTVG